MPQQTERGLNKTCIKPRTPDSRPSKRKANPKGRQKLTASRHAIEMRYAQFASAYMANGNNATKAAIAAGYAPRSAHAAGCRLLKHKDVSVLLAEIREKSLGITGLSVERTLREVARLAYADPRKLYDAEGKLKPIHELDDDTAATIAQVEVDEVTIDGKSVGYTRKLKQWDKGSALDKAMKYHQLYQDGANVGVQVVINMDDVDKDA